MIIRFVKMNGAGNDFVMIDNLGGSLKLSPRNVRALCDRTRGVGGDGVILLESERGFDFRMRYYNSDGGEVEMCGNGARCAARFAASLGLGDGMDPIRLRFVATPGPMEGRVVGGRAAISMTDASSLQIGCSLPVAKGVEKVHVIHTGVPHVVVEDAGAADLTTQAVVERGRRIRRHERFAPQGTNVNFVSVRKDGAVVIRTYERGVEAETLACGTGSVAAAVVLAHLGRMNSPVRLVTRGGEDLTVSFEISATGARGVVLEGPAAVNFEGTIELDGG